VGAVLQGKQFVSANDLQRQERIHRAVNVGKHPCGQVTVFVLDQPDEVAQPTEE